VIRSFRCSETARLFDDHPVRRFQEFERIARRKLLYLNGACRLDDLRVPPGNRLEQLKHDRAGTYSIRINDRWRAWREGEASDVEIVDYH
jgi:proteic killer suppression protein